MDIIKAYAVNNLCYIAAQKMTPAGIVVHSTGANNPYLKRYVDCPAEVGSNQYANHWNTATPEGRKVCVHAFIGYDKDNKVRVAEILPLDICCWGVGSGSKGSYNSNPPYIQFEICEDDLTDPAYYTEAFRVAAEYCAHLCQTYGLSTENIVSHQEAHAQGYGSNHSDPEHWMKRFGQTMDDLRREVGERLEKAENHPEPSGEAEKTTSHLFHKGDLVSIANGAHYYQGQSIPHWVISQNWYVKEEPVGDRVVIDRNERGTNAICSPVCAQDLTLVRSAQANAQPIASPCPYLVKVTVDSLEIRKGAGTNTDITGYITDGGVYTIVEEKAGTNSSHWGRLKSGAGWISLSSVRKL